LSIPELVRKSSTIDKILDERGWRESHLDGGDAQDIGTTTRENGNKKMPFGFGKDSKETIRGMNDVFFAGAKVLLAVVVNGPHPRGKSFPIHLHPADSPCFFVLSR
jgi:hypothetical protein